MPGRTPVRFVAREKEIRDQLDHRRDRERHLSYAFPFDDSQREWVYVSYAEYKARRKNVDNILAYCESVVARTADIDARHRLWNEEVLRKYTLDGASMDPPLWHSLLVRWLLRRWNTPAALRYFAGQRTVTEAFLEDAVRLDDDTLAHHAGELLRRRYCKPYLFNAELQRTALDLELERSQDELLAEFGPRFMLMLAQMWPPARVVSLGALVVEALINFVSFMYYLEDAQADGDVTEEELDEAYWQFAGIVPFKIVQLFLLGRALYEFGPEIVRMLIDAVRDYHESLATRGAALDKGWSGYATPPAGTMTFLCDEEIRRLLAMAKR
ncbi:MAG: hypothetical protein IT518_20325 [Burkholderiales bacterium]|nr:hypothetical protein [Burkholderiales bacterium]